MTRRSAKWLKILPALIAAVLVAGLSRARSAPAPALPFKVKAEAAVLLNAVSGQVLYEQNATEPIPPASLTKLMTLYIAYDAVDNGFASLNEPVRVSEKAWRTDGSRMFLEVNSTVPLETLLKGIAVVSANDACVAVAEHIAGVEDVFVEKMNRKAAELGLQHTVFRNSHGLPADGQVTTAHDIAMLAWRYIQHHPEALQHHAVKVMSHNNIKQRNRNGLLWLDCGVDGLKTGWFEEAGFHIVATALREGDRYITVVMGAQGERQRENIALKLIDYGFRNFKTVPVIEAGKPLLQAEVWKGRARHVPVGVQQSVLATIPRESAGEVHLEPHGVTDRYAPVALNEIVGRVEIILDGDKLKSLPLVALAEVPRAGLITRVWHTILIVFFRAPYWGICLSAAGLVVLVLWRLVAARRRPGSRSSGPLGDHRD